MPETRHSVCALDCPDTCSLLINVEDGHGSKLRGNPAHPVTRGFLCGKVARYLEREYHPDRLLYPQRRVGAKGEGRFERISWDEALDTIAERLLATAKEFGPESILPYSYAGSMGLLQANGMDRRFFHRLGASRLDRTICSTAGMAGMTAALGNRYATEPEQFRHSKLIIAWGANVLGHERPSVAVHRRGAAQRREVLRHRSPPQPHRRRGGQALLHQPGQRHGAGAGHDARDHRRRPARCGLRRELHRRFRCFARTRPRMVSAARSRADRHRGRGDRHPGPRIRHHSARCDSRELWRAAQRARLDGGADNRPAAGADRFVARNRRRRTAFHLAGVPSESGRAWSGPICSTKPSDAKRAWSI